MIQLTWEDPATGERREPRLNVPIAFGRECDQMPSEIGGERVSRIILSSDKVSRYHALIKREHNQLVVIDQNSTNCTLVNSDRCEPQKPFPLSDGDTLQIGSYRITLTIRATPLSSNFPPPVFQEI
ncbi:FHA domain-containing protein, partial [Aetokthonos hydrillicola Thurmond2011]